MNLSNQKLDIEEVRAKHVEAKDLNISQSIVIGNWRISTSGSGNLFLEFTTDGGLSWKTGQVFEPKEKKP